MAQPTEITGRMTKYNVVLSAITLLGLVLRVYHLGAQNFWNDEVWSFYVAKTAVPQILATLHQEVSPPLYYFILHYWMNLFGTSEFAIRFLSLIFGVVAIPMIYLLGRRLFNEEVGLISAFVLSISQLNIQYSQEARMYSMMLFLALLSMYFFVRFLERGSLAISVGYIVSTALVLYSHFFGLFVLIAQNIFLAGLLLRSKERRFQLKQWIPIQAIIVVIFAPWISVLTHQVQFAQKFTYNPYWTNADPITIVLQLAAGMWGSDYARVALSILFLGLAVFSAFTYRKAARRAFRGYAWGDRKNLEMVGLLFVWLLSVIALPLLFAPFSSLALIRARYMIAASAPLYILVAKGVRNINYNYAKFAIIAIIIILSAANLGTYYTAARNPTFANATDFVNTNAERGDLVILFPNPGVAPYYSYRSDLTVITFPVHPADLYAKTADQNMKELTVDTIGHPRVWIVTTQVAQTEALIKPVFDTLESSYNLTSSGFNSSRNPDVRLYVKQV